jgi:hypothetical protein
MNEVRPRIDVCDAMAAAAELRERSRRRSGGQAQALLRCGSCTRDKSERETRTGGRGLGSERRWRSAYAVAAERVGEAGWSGVVLRDAVLA